MLTISHYISFTLIYPKLILNFKGAFISLPQVSIAVGSNLFGVPHLVLEIVHRVCVVRKNLPGELFVYILDRIDPVIRELQKLLSQEE